MLFVELLLYVEFILLTQEEVFTAPACLTHKLTNAEMLSLLSENVLSHRDALPGVLYQ